MRELRLRSTELLKGTTAARIEWALHKGRWTLMISGVYGRGPEPPSLLDTARATALVTNGVCHGLVAGELHRFDNVMAVLPEVWVPRTANNSRAGVTRRTTMPVNTVTIGQVRCSTAEETFYELATRLDLLHVEQILEFCLRKNHLDRERLAASLNRAVRRVVELRGGLDVPPTESLLETYAVQLIRTDPSLPTPTRQMRIRNVRGVVVARVDLCWPELGVFLELDGQQHAGQPVYDARRQNDVTAAMGWRCVRLTWDDTVVYPQNGLAQLRDVLVGLVP